MIEADFPFLSFLIIVPLVGAILTGAIRNIDIAKHIAFYVAILTLLLSLFTLILFDPAHGEFQLVERYAWIPLLNIEYLVGVDGISILFLPMTALLTLITMLAAWNSISLLTRFHLRCCWRWKV